MNEFEFEQKARQHNTNAIYWAETAGLKLLNCKQFYSIQVRLCVISLNSNYNSNLMNQLLQTHGTASPNSISQELIIQQQQLILVLKQEIVRLQQQLNHQRQQKVNLQIQLSQTHKTIQFLNDKVYNISENNESLLRTVQVFQREFIKRDSGNGALNKIPIQKNGTGQFHLEVIRNLKSKIRDVVVQPSEKYSEKSPFSQYYGYFLQDQTVEQSAITLYNEIVEDKKPVRSSKIRALGKKSYFHQNFRHVFWFNSIENKQKITEKLYCLLVQIYQNNLENKPPKNSIIDLDLRRMDLKLEQDKSKKVGTQIKKLLQLFQLFRPDIKYVQGMSYLAWIFLIRMNPYRSFACFCNLILSDPFVHALYMFEEPKIKRIVAYFEECLCDKKPKLHKHMKDLGVDSQLFIIEWAYTLYSRTFSLRIVSKIWDLWFSEGYNTFFKVTMAVFELLEAELMQKNENDKFIEMIRTSSFKIEEAEFLRVLGKQKLFQELKLQ